MAGYNRGEHDDYSDGYPDYSGSHDYSGDEPDYSDMSNNELNYNRENFGNRGTLERDIVGLLALCERTPLPQNHCNVYNNIFYKLSPFSNF